MIQPLQWFWTSNMPNPLPTAPIMSAAWPRTFLTRTASKKADAARKGSTELRAQADESMAMRTGSEGQFERRRTRGDASRAAVSSERLLEEEEGWDAKSAAGVSMAGKVARREASSVKRGRK